MTDVFVLDARRTPRGKGSSKGALASKTPIELVVDLLRSLGTITDLGLIEDLVLGCATQTGAQGGNVAHTAALVLAAERRAKNAIPGVTINRYCASGIDAVNLGASRVRSGDLALVVTGGVESVSRVPIFTDGAPLYTDARIAGAIPSVHMGTAADLVATLDGITREELDAYAMKTRKKAREAWKDGRAGVAVQKILGAAGDVLLAADELLAFAPTAEEMASMPPAFAESGAEGQDALALQAHPEVGKIEHRHTKATSPPMADAAALVTLGTKDAATKAALRPLAKIVSTATVAVDPVVMLTGGQIATLRAIERAGLRPADVAVFEFAEAFSALSIKFQRALDLSDERMNAWGGTLALGHAFGATGAILAGNAVHRLASEKARYAVATVSGAGGVGVATVFERV